MSDVLRSSARFPAIAREAGHYESFYLKAAHPSEPRALWIRHTVWKAPGQEAVGSLWCTLFDAAWERPVAWKETVPPERLGVAPGEYIHVGDGRLAPGLAESPSWRLEFRGDDETFRYLPRDWMYRAKLPRTKAESLYPSVRYTGWAELDGKRLEVDGWPGMVGHNWGAEHAERWIWLHGAGDGWLLDGTFGRVRLGRWTTPWVGNALLVLDGRRHRLGGLGAARRTTVDEAHDGCRFALPGDGLRVEGEIRAAKPTFVGWVYSDPGGGEHNVVHSSVADLRVTVDGRTLETRGGATYELGMRETTHGVPLQPFSDP